MMKTTALAAPLLLSLSLGCSSPSLDAESPVDDGFTSLFDGTSLTGWTVTGGRYDGHASWEVQDGVIVGTQGPNGAGGLLYTEESYSSFELRLEAKIDYPFDSGIFLRMQPPETQLKGAQITLDYRPDGEVGAIYADGFLAHNTEGKDKFLRDQWNDLRVRCTGFDMRIECWLNGELLVDYQLPAGTTGYAPTGLIGLQVHGARDDEGSARFRNVRVRRLPTFGEDTFEPRAGGDGLRKPSASARAAGWEPLFDEGTLDGWDAHGPSDRYRWDNGVLAFDADGGGGFLSTRADFRDFRLRLDFKLSKMANSGVFLRSARDGSNPAYSGCEVQLLDDFHWEEETGSTLQPWQFTGSLYGAVPPGDREALQPIGTWNTYEILYQGARLAVALNGRTLYDVDTHALAVDPPFASRAASGFLGLQHHGEHGIEAETMAWFRNAFVQRLDEPAQEPTEATGAR